MMVLFVIFFFSDGKLKAVYTFLIGATCTFRFRLNSSQLYYWLVLCSQWPYRTCQTGCSISYILLKRVYKKGRKKQMDTRSYTIMIYNYIFNSALLMISYMFLFYNFICCFVSGIKIFKKKSFYILSLLCRGEVTTACILAT